MKYPRISDLSEPVVLKPKLRRQDAFLDEFSTKENSSASLSFSVSSLHHYQEQARPFRHYILDSYWSGVGAVVGLVLVLFLECIQCFSMQKIPGDFLPPNHRGEKIDHLWIPKLDRHCWRHSMLYGIYSIISFINFYVWIWLAAVVVWRIVNYLRVTRR
ncbi:hypothetical protein BDF14DRAFT_1853377 [Spinellus fusiger]|nr:hypothetical protein BDF14DRAFT_1853377 [Spinellus fusiger]